jgi:hypothetical protein
VKDKVDYYCKVTEKKKRQIKEEYIQLLLYRSIVEILLLFVQVDNQNKTKKKLIQAIII